MQNRYSPKPLIIRSYIQSRNGQNFISKPYRLYDAHGAPFGSNDIFELNPLVSLRKESFPLCAHSN